MSRFYTYVLSRPNGVPFYVGKGCGHRYTMCGGNKYAQNIYRQIVERNEKVGLCLIPAETEEAAFAEEMRLIILFGRLDLATGSLCNLTIGGDGFSSQEAKMINGLQTKEQLRNNGRKGGVIRQSLITVEERRCNMQTFLARLTLEQRQTYFKQLNSHRDPEKLREHALKNVAAINANMTLEQQERRNKDLVKARASINREKQKAAAREVCLQRNKPKPDRFTLDNLPLPERIP